MINLIASPFSLKVEKKPSAERETGRGWRREIHYQKQKDNHLTWNFNVTNLVFFLFLFLSRTQQPGVQKADSSMIPQIQFNLIHDISHVFLNFTSFKRRRHFLVLSGIVP